MGGDPRGDGTLPQYFWWAHAQTIIVGCVLFPLSPQPWWKIAAAAWGEKSTLEWRRTVQMHKLKHLQVGLHMIVSFCLQSMESDAFTDIGWFLYISLDSYKVWMHLQTFYRSVYWF